MPRLKAVVAVHLLLLKNGQLLMLRRANTEYGNGLYSVVAGHVDGNETVIEAMVREGREEAALALKPEDLDIVNVMHRKSPDHERIDFFLRATNWKGEPRNCEPEKCSDLRWFPLQQLPENTVPYVRKAIAAFAEGKSYSEYGWVEEEQAVERQLLVR